jgi:hypothetical protein
LSYLGQLQVGGQVIQFLNHRGYPVPSPACLQQIGDAFRRRVASFAEANHIPVVPLKAADRNIEVMRPYLGRAAATGRSQVAAIGVAQEVQRVFIARKRDTDPSRCPQFSFDKKDRRVTVFYFYLWDAGFGPAFIKICTYCPWPVKIWVNGHEWAKQQARKAGLGFTELSNGFASAEDPALLQRICDALQPGTISVFFQRWLHRLPLPLGPQDSKAGYWWECSMAQVEVSRTIMFDAPRHARGFFDALVTDNLDLGRPDTIEIIFGRQIRSVRQRATQGTFKTKVITRGVDVTVNAFYKHSRIKQYLKDGRALRIETVINAPGDLGCHRRLAHLDELQARARAVNARLLETERAGQGCPSAVVGVPAMIDVQDGYRLGVVVDGVPHAVLAAPGSPVASEWAAQRCADPARLLCERPVDELKARPGDGFGQAALQLPGGCRRDRDLISQFQRFPKRSLSDCST